MALDVQFTLKCVRTQLIEQHRYWVAELRDTSKLSEEVARGPRYGAGGIELALEQRLTAGRLAANNSRDLIEMIDSCMEDKTELEVLPQAKLPYTGTLLKGHTHDAGKPRSDYHSPTQKLEMEEDSRFWAEKDGRT